MIVRKTRDRVIGCEGKKGQNAGSVMDTMGGGTVGDIGVGTTDEGGRNR